MDDEPMWAADHVVAPIPGSAITILETANGFPIKGNHLTLIKENQFDGRTKTDPHKHIHEFLGICDMFKYRDTENEAVRLMMFPLSLIGEQNMAGRTQRRNYQNEMLQNCHGHNLSKGNIIKIFYRGLNETTQVVLNAAAGAENMVVEVGKFVFPADFVILEMEEDSKVPLILGRPFLYTADAVIRVKQKQLNLRVGTERMIFYIDYVMKHSYSNDDTCFSIDVIDKILEEDFDTLLDEGSEILHSIEGTILEEKLFAEFDEFMAMTADEKSESESDTEEPPFEKNQL
ncbi:reverse transcriptase domain-containing protein [Tanacetum coccineum]